MKLIEKLAEDWGIKNTELNLTGDGVFSEREAFEVGFRAAKALLETKTGLKPPIDGDDWLEITIENLRNLGEEEID